MTDTEKLRQKIQEFDPTKVVVHKRKRKKPTDPDELAAYRKKEAERSLHYYHKQKEENPEHFKEVQQRKGKNHYASLKANPVRYAKYLEQCRQSRARKRAAKKEIMNTAA